MDDRVISKRVEAFVFGFLFGLGGAMIAQETVFVIIGYGLVVGCVLVLILWIAEMAGI